MTVYYTPYSGRFVRPMNHTERLYVKSLVACLRYAREQRARSEARRLERELRVYWLAHHA